MREEATGETWGEFFDAALASIEELEEPEERPAETPQRAARWVEARRACLQAL